MKVPTKKLQPARAATTSRKQETSRNSKTEKGKGKTPVKQTVEEEQKNGEVPSVLSSEEKQKKGGLNSGEEGLNKTGGSADDHSSSGDGSSNNIGELVSNSNSDSEVSILQISSDADDKKNVRF